MRLLVLCPACDGARCDACDRTGLVETSCDRCGEESREYMASRREPGEWVCGRCWDKESN